MAQLLNLLGENTDQVAWTQDEKSNQLQKRCGKMGRTDILICPSCDYKRRMTEAETLISYALVVACLKCGAAMQCPSNTKTKSPQNRQTFLESCTPEALEEWVVS